MKRYPALSGLLLLAFAAPAAAQAVHENVPPPMQGPFEPIDDLQIVEASPYFIALTWSYPSGYNGSVAWTEVWYSDVRAIVDGDSSHAERLAWIWDWGYPGDPFYWEAALPFDPDKTHYFALKYYYYDEMTGMETEVGFSNCVWVSWDAAAPSAVADLSAAGTGESSIRLSWTAPGDDEDEGQADLYEIKFSTQAPGTDPEAWWNSVAQPVPGGSLTPRPAGSPEQFVLDGLPANTTYHFAIRSRDEVPNWSGLSAVVQGATLPDDGVNHGGGDLACGGSAGLSPAAGLLLLGLAAMVRRT